MIANHIKIRSSDDRMQEESFFDARTQRVSAALGIVFGRTGKKGPLRLIKEATDYKGTLIVIWAVMPTDSEKGQVNQAWADVGEENVNHMFEGPNWLYLNPIIEELVTSCGLFAIEDAVAVLERAMLRAAEIRNRAQIDNPNAMRNRPRKKAREATNPNECGHPDHECDVTCVDPDPDDIKSRFPSHVNVRGEWMEWPATLEQAVDIVILQYNEGLCAAEVIAILEAPHFHFTGGMALRNWLGLWNKTTPLSQHFRSRFGLGHADDIGAIIIKATLAKLKGQDYDPTPDVERFKAHWRANGIDPLTGKPPTGVQNG